MKKFISRWYLIQNIIALITIVVLHLNIPLTIISGIVLALSVIFNFDFIQSKKLKDSNWFIQFFLQPLAVVMAWDYVYFELVQYHLNNWFLSTILFLYYLVMFVPFAYVIAAKAKNLFLRLIFIYSQYFIIGFIVSSKNSVLLHSNVLQAVAYLIFVVLLMHLWGAAGPDVKSNKKENALVIIVLIFIILFYAFINASNNLDTFQELIKDISKDNVINFWESIRAGIGEEITIRYAVAVCLLWIFSKSVHRLVFAILGSSIIFGLSHLVNLTNSQALEATIYQVLNAFAIGLIFMTIFLYTGKIWVTMLLHFIIDWSSTFVSGTLVENSILGPNLIVNYNFTNVLILIIVFGLVLIWMMHGKRRQVMEEHAKALIKK
ncbi:CPBP family intramembrane glutamic endopeptidase [Lactobacillus sp.]|uniref:CPBP family intramembrane glutamic endopeptidase n=1 Tax=Lactobacillus sp. TaxID=1591 RepID=UPI0019C18615|nr:CPBP family intramembrane glutamic endopeptidase [Lactobacillus sp.]MBD5429004.1 CPBP family intramembrane metalloprotease [Lactobacillus sp.]